jgi:hypothetical protein
VSEGVVFGEGLADEFEGEAKPGEHGAQGNEFSLGAVPFGLPVAWLAEHANHLWCVGQVDIGSVHG